MNSTNSKTAALSSLPISHAPTMSMDFVGILLTYCQTLGPKTPIYSVRKSRGTWQCTLSLPFSINFNMTKDFMVVQSTKPLAMSVSACIACTLLLQQGKLDSNLMPFSDVASVPKLTTFGNNVLTSDKQEELGLGYMDGSILRVALSPYSKDMVSCSWAALGEAFLKFVFSAYNFARYQEDTEGILTARVGNELMIAVLSEYLELSQLTGYTCCPHVYNFQSISATTLRRVIGAAIVQIGADAGVRTIGALGMMTDASVNSIKDIDSIYKRYQAYVPMSLTLSDRQQASFSRSLKFKIEKVQGALGYKFRCPQLLIEAITHSSASPSALAAASYERLEFLGDAVLEFAVANHYHKRYPATNIKKFRMFKSLILANDALGSLCANLGLEEVITANQEINNCCKFDAARAVKLRASGVTKLDGLKLNKILGDVLEALVGAVFVDGGFSLAAVDGVLCRTLIPYVDGSNLSCHIGNGVKANNSSSNNNSVNSSNNNNNNNNNNSNKRSKGEQESTSSRKKRKQA